MSEQPRQSVLRLKRRQLGVCAGVQGEVYLADGQADPPRVHVLPREYFIGAVKSGQIRARRWCAAMPRRECLVKRISLPTGSEEEARQMLEYEVPGLVPMQDGGLCYDVLPLSHGGEGVSDYLVFLSPLDRIEKATSVLREAGVTPDVVLPDSVSLWRWLRRHVGEDKPSLLVCVDPNQCQILAVAEGRLEGAREVALAAGAVVDVAVLLAEAQRVLPGESELELGRTRAILLAGRKDMASALAEQLRLLRSAAGVGDLTTEVCSSTAQVELGAWGEAQVDVSDLGVLAALGCALEEAGRQGEPFNLVPTEWRERHARGQRRAAWIKTIGLTAAVPVLVWTLLAVRIARLDARCERYAREMAPIKDTAVALEVKKRQTNLIETQLSDRSLPLEILAELYRRVPEGVSLSHLTMDLDPADPQLVMKGPAGSLEAAFAFPLVLDESPLFTDVRPEAAQQVSHGQGVLIEFGCRCRVDLSKARNGA